MTRIRPTHPLRVLLMSLCFVPLGAQVASEEISVPRAVVHYPDMIVYSGKIVTMDDTGVNENPGTIVEAMAIRDGKVMAMGSSRTIMAYAGPDTKQFALKGRTVIPGIINSHIHIHDQALNEWFDKNPQQAQEAVGVYRISGTTAEELQHRIEVVLEENVSNLEEDKWAFLYLPNGPRATGTGLGVGFLQDQPITAEKSVAFYKQDTNDLFS